MSDQGAAPAAAPTTTTSAPATEPATNGAAAPAANGEPATPAKSPAEQQAAEARRYKLRVEGEEREVDEKGLLAALLDDMGEDGVLSAAQISATARKRMRAVSDERKRLSGLAARLKDPKQLRAVIDELYGESGGARGLAEEIIAEHIEEARMPEGERAMRKRIAELESREARLREKEEREQMSAREQQVTQAQQHIGSRFAAALTEAGMTPTPYAIARMAALAESALDDGIPVDPRQLAREVSRDYEDGEMGTLLKSVSGDPAKLIKLIGKQGLDALRKYDIEQTRAKQRPAASPVARGAAPPRQAGKPALNPDEWLDRMKGR